MILCYVFKITALFVVQEVRCLKPENCDPSLNSLFREGILGQVGMFPWLGVIRVELHEGVNIRTALTGAIIIKEKYALTIADDIARIPKKIFQRDSRALFIPTDGEPWLCKLKKYIAHPEYPYIKNTIALIELELENQGPTPLIPICWQTYSYDASSQLYVLGITDANDVLEKEVYKVQYVQQSQCMEWYEKKGFNTEDDESTDYQCVSAINRKKQCVFETGMVLASNTTGTWTLLGFGIYGPGCASPSRFIAMYKYFSWIESTINDIQTERSYDTKKRFGDQNIPIHQMFRSGNDPESRIVPYIPDHYEGGLTPDVVRVDRTAIIIFNNKYEMDQGDCFVKSSLIYSDSFKIHADFQKGRAHYLLSLMDLSVMNYTCVLVRVNAGTRSNATLWYNYGDYIEPLEGSETPKELLKKYPLPTRDEEEEDDDITTTTNKSPSTTSKRSREDDDKTTTTETSRGNSSSNTTPRNSGEDKNTNNTPENSGEDKNRYAIPVNSEEDENSNTIPGNPEEDKSPNTIPENSEDKNPNTTPEHSGEAKNPNTIPENSEDDRNSNTIPGNSEEDKNPNTTPEHSGEAKNPNTIPENSGDDRNLNTIPGNSEEDKNPNTTPEQSGEDKNPNATPENSEEDKNSNTIPGNSGEDRNPNTTPEHSGEDKNPNTTPEHSGEDKNPNATPENSGEDKNPDTIPGNSGEDKNPNTTPENSGDDKNSNTAPKSSEENKDKLHESDLTLRRHTRRIIKNNRRYKKLISDSLINNLRAIKSELETTKIELNISGKADINKTFKKMFAIKSQLNKVQDKLGRHAPASLKDSINILDKAASKLRAGQVFYEGKLMDIREQEIQQSINLIKELREQPEIVEIKTQRKKETFKKPRPRGRQGKKKPWKPHKQLEKQYITDRPGWWLYYPHLNLELDFYFDEEAEMTIEVWSHRKVISPTKGPEGESSTRTRTPTPITKATNNSTSENSNNTNTNKSPEINVNTLIAQIDPSKLPPPLTLENATLLFEAILPKKLPGNTTLKTLPSFIDPDKLPSDMSLATASFLVSTVFDGMIPASFLRQKMDDAVRYIGSLKRFFRKDSKFGAYSELKRAEYYDDVIKIRGIDFLDDDQPDKSDIIRSDRLFLVALVIYILLSNLDVF